MKRILDYLKISRYFEKMMGRSQPRRPYSYTSKPMKSNEKRDFKPSAKSEFKRHKKRGY